MSSQVINSSSGSSIKSLPTPQGDAFNYALYLHREELRKRGKSSMSASRTKLLLTQELISKTVKNISKCSADDLRILSRETIFKKNLHRELARQRHRHYLQMLRLRNQQKENESRRNYDQSQTCQQQQQSHEFQQQQFYSNTNNSRTSPMESS